MIMICATNSTALIAETTLLMFRAICATDTKYKSWHVSKLSRGNS